jgi:hypothetical protein
MVANFIRMCNLYSITTNQAAIAPLFRVAGLEGVVSKVRDSPCERPYEQLGEGHLSAARDVGDRRIRA